MCTQEAYQRVWSLLQYCRFTRPQKFRKAFNRFVAIVQSFTWSDPREPVHPSSFMLSDCLSALFHLSIGMPDPIHSKHKYCMSQLSFLTSLTRHDSCSDHDTSSTKDVSFHEYEYRFPERRRQDQVSVPVAVEASKIPYQLTSISLLVPILCFIQ